MNEFSKKYRSPIVAAVSILSAVFTYFVAKEVKNRIDESRSIESFVKEWTTYAVDYRRRIALIYSNSADSGLERILLNEGYGVMKTDDSTVAVSALEMISPDVVLTDANTIPEFRHDSVKLKGRSYAVRAKIPDLSKKARAGDFLASIDEKIERRNAEVVYRPLRRVIEYAGASGNRDFHLAPEKVASDLADFLSNVNLIAPYDLYDSHQGGVLPIFNGEPIKPNIHYDTGEGICIKVFKISDYGSLEQLVNDTRVDSKTSSAEAVPIFARHRFYSVTEKGELIDVISYFIAPTLAYVGNFVNTCGLKPEEKKKIKSSIMHSLFEAAINYSAYHQRRNPITPERIAAVTEYYKKSLADAYEKLAILMESINIERDDFLQVTAGFDDPDLKTSDFYSRVMDLLVSNFKLAKFNIQNPGYDELMPFLVHNGSIIRPEQISENLRIYDQGYKDSHIADNFSRAAFSPHFGGIDDDWINLAMHYTGRSISGTNGGIMRIIRRVKDIPPDIFMKHLGFAASQKLFRLICYSVSAAEDNEISYASGRVQPKDYHLNRRNYVVNAGSYSKSLWLFALTAASYFELEKRPRGYSEMWDKVRECYEAAKRGNPEKDSFQNDLSRIFSTYALIGYRIMREHDIDSEKGPIFEILKKARESRAPFIVKYIELR